MRNRWAIAIAAGLTCLFGFGSRGVFGIFYVQMLREFSWDRASLAGAYSLGMLLMGIGGPVAGSLSRRFGLKKFYFFSAVLLGLTYFLTSRVHTLAQVYLTFGLLGGIVLAALGFGPSQGLAARWFKSKRGLAIGIVGAGAGMYPLLAPFAQFFVDILGWRDALVALGVLFSVVVAILGTLVLREPPEITETSGTSDRNVLAEPRRIPWTLRLSLKTSPIWLITLTWFCLANAIHFIYAHLAALLIDIGYSAMVAAGVIAIIGVFSVISRVLGGFLSDHFGRVSTFIGGATTSIIALLVLSYLLYPSNGGVEVGSMSWVYSFAVLFGVGTGAQTTQLTTLASDMYMSPFFSSIVGFLTIGFGLGGALGPWLGGFIYEATGSYQGMIFYVILALVCSSVSLAAAGRRIWSYRESLVHPEDSVKIK